MTYPARQSDNHYGTQMTSPKNRLLERKILTALAGRDITPHQILTDPESQKISLYFYANPGLQALQRAYIPLPAIRFNNNINSHIVPLKDYKHSPAFSSLPIFPVYIHNRLRDGRHITHRYATWWSVVGDFTVRICVAIETTSVVETLLGVEKCFYQQKIDTYGISSNIYFARKTKTVKDIELSPTPTQVWRRQWDNLATRLSTQNNRIQAAIKQVQERLLQYRKLRTVSQSILPDNCLSVLDHPDLPLSDGDKDLFRQFVDQRCMELDNITRQLKAETEYAKSWFISFFRSHGDPGYLNDEKRQALCYQFHKQTGRAGTLHSVIRYTYLSPIHVMYSLDDSMIRFKCWPNARLPMLNWEHYIEYL